MILSKDYSFSKEGNDRFINFLDIIGDHTYLRKTIIFLLFIGHCTSIDKCKQTELYRERHDPPPNLYLQASWFSK